MNSYYEQASKSLTNTIVTILTETQGGELSSENKQRVVEAVSSFVDLMREGGLEEIQLMLNKIAKEK